jgi:Endoplasmic reticulum vesicle transporter
LVGFVIVNKVPGNFHISAHPFQHVLPKVLVYAGISTLDLSHKINHLSFGDQTLEIKQRFGNQGVLNPLDGLERIKNKELKHVGVMHQYYISVVPTTYIDTSNREYFVH